jgi:hypothetical protein
LREGREHVGIEGALDRRDRAARLYGERLRARLREE